MAIIAAIYFDTSSVGGIATEANTFRLAAKAAGDTLHVLRCPNQKSKKPTLYPEPKLIRGGDTYIGIDGEISHHEERIEETLSWLEDNYDGLFFLTPCPHPTKAYGGTPWFMPLYTDSLLPKVSRVMDAYWSTYADWGNETAKYVNAIFVNQLAYAIPLEGSPAYDKVKIVRKPFIPLFPRESSQWPEREYNLLVWPSQQKNIKGWKGFLKELPNLPEYWNTEIYSCGIEYYQQRTGVDWFLGVGEDHFKPEFSGIGRAQYFGFVQLDVIAQAYTRAAATVDFQGHAVKYDAYKQGSYNNTTLEALYYGAVPILHSQALKSIVPSEFFLTVEAIADFPAQLEFAPEMARDTKRRFAAQDWVMDEHGADAVYNAIKQELLG